MVRAMTAEQKEEARELLHRLARQAGVYHGTDLSGIRRLCEAAIVTRDRLRETDRAAAKELDEATR